MQGAVWGMHGLYSGITPPAIMHGKRLMTTLRGAVARRFSSADIIVAQSLM